MPRYGATSGRWAKGDTITAVASASRASSGNSGTLDADFIVFDFLVDVTVAGTTLNVAVEESSDASTWTAVANVNQNGVGSTRLRGTVVRRYYRVVWTITGTAYTFSVAGDVK